jgi:hypothetical protein
MQEVTYTHTKWFNVLRMQKKKQVAGANAAKCLVNAANARGTEHYSICSMSEKRNKLRK